VRAALVAHIDAALLRASGGDRAERHLAATGLERFGELGPVRAIAFGGDTQNYARELIALCDGIWTDTASEW
jgi:hypothetical protein